MLIMNTNHDEMALITLFLLHRIALYSVNWTVISLYCIPIRIFLITAVLLIMNNITVVLCIVHYIGVDGLLTLKSCSSGRCNTVQHSVMSNVALATLVTVLGQC